MNPAMAGLGALTQQSGQPTGMPPQSMSKIMSLAKSMSDSQLADVLAGKSMDLPQYVAMTEAMGRKQLRTAMQGMTAMTTAKQPTEREKLLSEMVPRQQPQTMMSVPPQGAQPAAGIDTLPADNMQGLGHADGGIIAFAGDSGSLVPKTPAYKGEPVDDAEYQESIAVPKNALSNWWAKHMAEIKKENEAAAAARGQPLTPSKAELEGVDPTDASEFLKTLKPAGTVPGVAPPKAGGTNTGSGPGGSGPGGGGPGGGGPGGYGGGSLAGTDLSKFATEQAELLRPKERNKDYYEALTKPTEDIAKQVASGKEQAQGEFLMQLGASLMSTPNIGLAVSKGVQAGLPGLAASRKEINALTKDQRDYQFNIAKAKEARDQGDEMLALNYLKLAEESKYHAGMVGAYMARAGNAAAFGPKQYQAAMTNAQKEVDNRIGKMGPLDKRKLTPETRQQMIEDAFTRNLEAYRTGSIPATQDPSLELFDNPGGPILKRP